MSLPLDIAPEVANALTSGGAIVALESTIITHGMPKPENVRTALAVERDIRAEGAVPATIAVMGGRLMVGLSEDQLNELADATGVAKLSRADMAVCIARGGTGSTTVAATMIAARLAGIEVFATGGIGGVHPGAAQGFDISADLQELAQTAVTVVSAGPKAILDVPSTLEVLETLGVPVFAFGQDTLPAFWSRDSGIPAPLRADTADQIAASHAMRRKMGIPGGQLVANPVPLADEIPRDEILPIIDAANKAALDRGIGGKALTPFLLDRILGDTGGRSLKTNIALVRNNARLAARIAIALTSR